MFFQEKNKNNEKKTFFLEKNVFVLFNWEKNVQNSIPGGSTEFRIYLVCQESGIQVKKQFEKQ